MKTEKEFADFFADSCRHEVQFAEQIKLIAKNHWLDLTAHLNTYFSNEDRLNITKKAAEQLAHNFKTMPPEEAWPAVIRNFLANQYWGFQPILQKPQIKKTPEQQIFWNLFKYVWAFVQSMFIIKTAVYFFGIEATRHPEKLSIGWMWLFFTISVGSLFFFAYRNRNEKD